MLQNSLDIFKNYLTKSGFSQMTWSIFIFSRNVDMSNTPNPAAEDVEEWYEAEELRRGGRGLGTDRDLGWGAADQHLSLLEEEDDLEKTMWSCTLDFQNNFGLSKNGVLENFWGENRNFKRSRSEMVSGGSTSFSARGGERPGKATLYSTSSPCLSVRVKFSENF